MTYYNVEFEAKLFKDLLIYREGGMGGTSITIGQSNSFVVEYENWLVKVCRQSKFTEADLSKAYDFAKDWNYYKQYSDGTKEKLKYDDKYQLLLIKEFILNK